MYRWLGLVVCTVAFTAPAAHGAETFGGVAPQVRVSAQGADGDPSVDATAPTVAYNSRRDEFLVVWAGHEATRARPDGIFARRLTRSGTPVGDAVRIGHVDGHESYVERPKVVYDAERDRYAVVYGAHVASGNDGFLDSTARFQFVRADGTAVGEFVDLGSSHVSRDSFYPAIAFSPVDDRYLVVFFVLPQIPMTAKYTIVARAVGASSGHPAGQPEIVALAAEPGGFPADLTLAWRPDGRYVLAFEERDGRDATQAWLRTVVLQESGAPVADDPLGVTTGLSRVGAGRQPALAPHHGDPRALLAYTGEDAGAAEGSEIFVRVIDSVGAAGSPRRVSFAGAAGSASRFSVSRPAIAYHPAGDLYLVTWIGTDDDRPGMTDDEVEVSARFVDVSGGPLGDTFVVSRMGAAGRGWADASGPAVAVNGRNGEVAVAWSGEHPSVSLAPGELEIWARRLGPDPPVDDDQDGVPLGADCDDLDPDIRPGMPDRPYDRIDQDCSGADSLDYDGDGHEPPRDCDDTRADVHPGGKDVAGNGRDEDCVGGDRSLTPRARVRATWLFGALSTRAAVLRVEHAPAGALVTVRCTGQGCPTNLRGAGRRIRTDGGRARLTRLLGGARLHPGATVTVRVAAPQSVQLIERFTMRAGAAPRQKTRCLVPGRRRTGRCG